MVSAQRSYNMSRIRGTNTKPEIIVRKFLWSRGFRYRLNHKRLPGKPDVVLKKYRTCIFVNGCFWHGHLLKIENFQQMQNSECRMQNERNSLRSYDNDNDNYNLSSSSLSLSFDGIENSACCKIPHTNREFWVKKILRNRERDEEVQHALARMGWHCLTVWECELKPAVRVQTLEALAFTLNEIYLKDHSVKKYQIPEDQKLLAAEPENKAL